jgi:hypothetical protein
VALGLTSHAGWLVGPHELPALVMGCRASVSFRWRIRRARDSSGD